MCGADGEMVFQVTKRGDSVIVLLLRWEDRRGCRPMGMNDDEEEVADVEAELALGAVREVVDVDEEGVDELERELEFERRWRAGMRGVIAGLFVFEADGRCSSEDVYSSTSDTDSVANSSSSSSSPLG